MTVVAVRYDDPLADDLLFDVDAPPPVALADKFVFFPGSVLPRVSGEWSARKKAWGRYGFRSELGRDSGLAYALHDPEHNDFAQKMQRVNGATSVFDPVVCELAYRWFSLPGDRVLDPFAGGSIRGGVASILDRRYVGVDLSARQIAANREQVGLCTGPVPDWIVGDATDLADAFFLAPVEEFDLVFSCPPYGDLEAYSADPRDLSAMRYPQFVAAHRLAIAQAVAALRPDRYAAWVISDIRDPRTGLYRGLVSETVAAFAAAGAGLLNEVVLPEPLATHGIRTERPFRANRKICRVHQILLIFVKGSVKAAADRVESRARGAAL